MNIGIISDIHSNLEALNAVMEDIRAREVDQIWCLGDIVGYNADPDRCCEIVRKMCRVVIMGNHDSAVVGNFEPHHFNRVAREAVMWGRKVLKRSSLDYLKTLRSAVVFDDVGLIVHGSPTDPDKYVISGDSARNELLFMVKNLRKKVCFFGHTHFPVAYELDGRGEDDFHVHPGNGSLSLKEESGYLINPGSVGQPRDGDQRASYLLFDKEKMTVRWMRVPYDIQACQEKIIQAGLPHFLAERLERGY